MKGVGILKVEEDIQYIPVGCERPSIISGTWKGVKRKINKLKEKV